MTMGGFGPERHRNDEGSQLGRVDGYHALLAGNLRVEVSRRYWPLLRSALRGA